MPPKTLRTQPEAAPRKRRKREQEVLDAAAQVFYERGYADATVQDVADALGILKGSLYYYIKTKEDLLFRLLEEVHDDVDALLEETSDDDGAPPLEQLRAYIGAQTDYNLRNIVKITVYYHDVQHLTDERRNLIIKRRKAHEDHVTRLIRQAQAEGTVDGARDPRLLSNCVFSTIIWTYQWYRPRRHRIQEVVDTCADYAIAGVTGAP